jgi:hypothetical protein
LHFCILHFCILHYCPPPPSIGPPARPPARPARPGPARPGPARPGQAGPGRAGPGRAGPGRAEPGRAGWRAGRPTGDHGGGVVPPRPPQPQPKGSRLKATPTRRGSADLLRYLRSGVSPVVIAKDPVLQLCAMGLTR